MLKRISGIVLFIVGLWLILPYSFYGKGLWVYLLGIAKGLGPVVLIVMGILLFYMEMTEKPKKR